MNCVTFGSPVRFPSAEAGLAMTIAREILDIRFVIHDIINRPSQALLLQVPVVYVDQTDLRNSGSSNVQHRISRLLRPPRRGGPMAAGRLPNLNELDGHSSADSGDDSLFNQVALHCIVASARNEFPERRRGLFQSVQWVINGRSVVSRTQNAMNCIYGPTRLGCAPDSDARQNGYTGIKRRRKTLVFYTCC